MLRTFLRAARGALVIFASIVAAAGCESRRGTGLAVGGDLGAPNVRIDVPGSANDSLNVSSPVTATVDANDDISLLLVVDSVFVDGVLVRSDSAGFTTATTTYTKAVGIPVAGIRSGQQVRIVAVARDGSGNTSFAVRVLTAYDTTSPRVVVTGPPAGTIVRPGGTDSISVSATDSSGLSLIGYELHTDSVIAPGSLPVAQASVAVTGNPVQAERTFPPNFPSTLQPGRYFVRGLAEDISQQRGFSALVAIVVQDTAPPTLDLRQPPDGGSILVTDTVIAEAHITDNGGLARLSIVGVAIRGDPNLGATDTVTLYDSVFVPVNFGTGPGSFPPGVLDTLVQRLMVPVSSIASEPDTLVLFIARVTDRAGNATQVINSVRRVSGPSLRVTEPVQGDSVAPGQVITVTVTGDDPQGIATIGYNLSGPSYTRTRLDTLPGPLPQSHTFTDTITIPLAAVVGDSVTISPRGSDGGNRPGTGPSIKVVVGAVATDNVAPLVYQTVAARLQSTDSLFIRAVDNSGIQQVGYQIYQVGTNTLIAARDSIIPPPFVSGRTYSLPVTIPAAFLGDTAYVFSYAIDALGNKGFSIPSSSSTARTDSTTAKRDTVLLAFGATTPLPSGALGADIAVNAANGRVFVSNIAQNRIDIWQASDSSFFGSVAVGSEPWGMAVDTTGDTLIVANSGGTNFSVVSFTSLQEERRIKTQNSIVADVGFTVQDGIFRYTLELHDYSDRPQNVGVSANGNIFYSTRPTATAPDGTIRFYDMRRREVQQMWQYGVGAAPGQVLVLNIDSIFVITSFDPNASDEIRVCGHPYGTPGVSRCRQHPDLFIAVDSLRTVDQVAAVLASRTAESLALTDTTFVAVGGDRRWIAFGEANTANRAGRIMLARDTSGTDPDSLFFSPGISVTDLTNNASEQVLGLALNSNSSLLAAHGAMNTYFADVDDLAFQQRLQGLVAGGPGAGVAFHPDNDGTQSDIHGVVFVTTDRQSILVVDSWNFYVRREIPVGAGLTGALVASRPFATDDPAVVVKLFAVTATGFITIDLRQSDIDP